MGVCGFLVQVLVDYFGVVFVCIQCIDWIDCFVCGNEYEMFYVGFQVCVGDVFGCQDVVVYCFVQLVFQYWYVFVGGGMEGGIDWVQ